MSQISEKAMIFPGSVVTGDVSIGDESSVWYHAVLRGDADAIYIGERTNIQDNATVHVDKGFPVKIGNGVSIGHGAIIHGCEIEDDCIIGMGAVLLNGAKIGRNCIIGAGTLVPEGKEIPPESVAFGNPVRIHRKAEDADRKKIRENAREYVELAEKGVKCERKK